MKLVKIKNKKSGLYTHESKFETQEHAQAWIDDQSALGSWGKLERWVADYLLQVEGLNADDAIETRVESTGDRDVTLYKFAAEFEVEVSDITAQVLAEKKLQLRLAKQSFGAYLIAKITEMNSAKGFDASQLAALMADPAAAALERLLWSGSLDFAKASIQAYAGQLYSSEEKAALVAEIDAWKAANPEP